MPGLDGTGPMGRGPLTGRGFGPCGRGRGFGAGYGRGFGRGYGYGYGYRSAEPINLSKEEQKKILQAELNDVEAEKEELKKRIQELE